MRQQKIINSKLFLLVASLVIIFVVPGITQAKTTETLQIHLKFGSFDPLISEPYIASGQRISIASIDETTYLLQFSGPVLAEWKTALEQAGVRLYDYVPDYAFIARMGVAAAAEVQELPFVHWVGPYHPAYRISPSIQDMLSTTSIAEPLVL
ncbi:hypothetical protein KA005_80005, partial [bacterium]|nr:hypothetical protein [bacterium]